MPVPPLSPIEKNAREIIARFLGVPVVQHDDQSAPRLPDLRIEYPDRPHAVVEVVRDVNRDRPQQRDALYCRGWSIDDPLSQGAGPSSWSRTRTYGNCERTSHQS